MRIKGKTSPIKRIIQVIVLSLGGLAILLAIIPINIKKEIPAVEIKLGDPEYLYACTISIKGDYRVNFITADTFDGNITVSGYDQTKEKMVRISLSKDPGSWLYYQLREEDDTARPSLEYCLGLLKCGRFFTDMAICVLSQNPTDRSSGWKEFGGWGVWNERTGYCVVPWATTYDEAMERLTKIGIISSLPTTQFD